MQIFSEASDRKTNQELRAKLEHYDDGKRQVETASYEGSAYSCACGANFMEKRELEEHVATA